MTFRPFTSLPPTLNLHPGIATEKSRPWAAFSSGNLLAGARNAEALVEAVNAATGRNITLLASVERVAFTAHVEVQVVTYGRTDFHDITARARSSNFFVFRMNIFFMGEPQLRPRRSSSPNARHHAMLIISRRNSAKRNPRVIDSDAARSAPKAANHTEFDQHMQTDPRALITMCILTGQISSQEDDMPVAHVALPVPRPVPLTTCYLRECRSKQAAACACRSVSKSVLGL